MSEEERERLRPLGRRLVELVSEYMTKGARRSQLIDEAREIGHEYGKELVGDRLSIRDAIEAFAFFRKGLDDAAMELAQKNDLSAEEAVEVWELTWPTKCSWPSPKLTSKRRHRLQAPTRAACATTRCSWTSPASQQWSSAAARWPCARWKASWMLALTSA
jgi:hypothetical protein